MWAADALFLCGSWASCINGKGRFLTPCSSEIWGAVDPKLKTKKHVLGPPHMPNMVKIRLRAWAGLIPSLSPHWFSPFLCFCYAVLMRPLDRSQRLMARDAISEIGDYSRQRGQGLRAHEINSSKITQNDFGSPKYPTPFKEIVVAEFNGCIEISDWPLLPHNEFWHKIALTRLIKETQNRDSCTKRGVFKVRQFSGVIKILSQTDPCCHLEIFTHNYL